ncbi:FAD-binding dehydrogenase [Arsenicicoccus sp. oral taxon 190]|uniref:FAD-binding dehydrogenase n=1 Tax=Arsenicicoccus sp. oral taxon 190 TaxID=1658671 RepID=UPI00067A4153|nr:FAD-binding dehydrogenase [Arsenicicoccus sp. oral taxon 190]AKT50514.1 FAD-binding dehydrogenase [Arsenicicoccus sp. oral taxon 190]
MDADVIVVGAGLAGLVAACEAADAGRQVLLLDQEGEQSLGGQAYWSFGGLFLVDSPEQRRLRVRDSEELAWADWEGTAGFDRPEDHWPREWARAYVHFAAGEKRSWLRQLGHRLFPVVGWAERGGYAALGPGNSVPRFHITWGTGPGVVEPFERRVRDLAHRGLVRFGFRHRVDSLVVEGDEVVGVRVSVLEPDDAERGRPTSRTVLAEQEIRAQAVVLTTGGIGGDHELVRAAWPPRLGQVPTRMVTGVPAHVDGRGIGIAHAAGASLIHPDRMWHYTEGVHDWDPIWPGHGIRILPGPSSLWLDAHGRRLPGPLYPGFDTLGTLAHLRRTGADHSWFVLTRTIAGKELALSGQEQNLDLTQRSWRGVAQRATTDVPAAVQAFLDHGEDFLQAPTLDGLIEQMTALEPGAGLDPEQVRREVRARDLQVANPFGKDGQLAHVRDSRNYLGDKLIRTAPPHRLEDPEHGPMIAIRLSVLTRKTLGGIETDLSGRVLRPGGAVLPGLYAAGEAAGFGGGGMHGYRALEGTFLGGCLFSGRQAGRAVAAATA